MILDFTRAPELARCYNVVDVVTGDCLDELHWWYADDEIGLIKRYALDGDGQYIIAEDGINLATIEEKRPIRLELKASHRVGFSIPKIDAPRRRR